MNYYILVPWGETGGPEGLHQLCYELVHMKKNARIIYYDPWQDRIQSEYKGKICGRYNEYDGVKSFSPNHILDIDELDNVVILPEICRIRHIEMFKKAKVVYLRLSNNTQETALDPENYDSLYHPIFKTCYTGCDPFLIYKKIKESSYDMNKVFMLRPNINLSHIRKEDDLHNERKNFVLFNPSKGKQHVDRLIEYSKKFDIDIDIEFIPLQGMTKEQLKEIIYTSKLYIDFGHFPGPDRLSREAASGGCVVLIGKRGSGSDSDDFPLEDKIDWNEDDDSFDYEKICLKIIDIIKNYNTYFNNQKEYRKIIRNERNKYIKQIKKMISILEEEKN